MANGKDGDLDHTPVDTAHAAKRMNDIRADDILLPYSLRPNAPKPMNVEPAYVEQLEEDVTDE